ncbi:Stress response protein nst1 [Golovinomyces cichoracearum]|uniref:Stress response protein NST1 n=1 Tax=Golovinomyces cichoracearum TaxID=62708 RepID=A0A420IEW5_9PEZI|nr:Stress response protein nst1 [Golovinomyces cichoracearum]
MPANRRQQNSQFPAASMTAKTVSKYSNKDSPKPTDLSKVPTNHDSEILSTTAQTSNHINGQVSAAPKVNGTPSVNRKKQKRREKEAAKRAAAGQIPNTRVSDVSTSGAVQKQIQDLEARFREHRLDEQYNPEQQFDPVDDEPYYSEEAYSGSFGANGSPQTGYPIPSTNNSAKKSKKKKKSKSSQSRGAEKSQGNGSTSGHMGLPVSSIEQTRLPRGQGISKEKIWNTSSQEERERIKEFWLSLSEDERKSLVKVEKDAVLKKMKEQQKHSCSCTVCGRKRTAIEEELEVLYDAYYEELEQYANHQVDVGNPMIPPPRRFGPLNGLQPPNLLPPSFNSQKQSRGRIMEQIGDDDYDEGEVEGDEEYSQDEGDDEDDEDYSDEEPEELPRSHAADFFNFGNSLTVQGGILTVADDLLKNDGKKFIEMMEQLAERRMAREEDAREQFSNTNYGQPYNATMPPHSHQHTHSLPPEGEDCDDEEEEEEEYDSQDEDYDEEEMDTMTEEQRMEEGRRMFQIFAARMFEQRVLTAYKKKVSEERTQRLLEELEEENKARSEKQAKKARDAQKRKEKLAQKKQALAEEKARREAEEAEKLAALRLAEEKKAEEARIRAEEKRKKKEAQKRAEEEERQRKEAEKARRLQEQRERQVEQERKQREAKEKERKEKDEQRQKEKEAKEVKDRETKERRDKQERERSESLAKEEAIKLAKEKQKFEENTSQKDATQATPNNAISSKRLPIPIPANLQPHPVVSPHVPIAIPAFQKAPTPIKLRTSSIQQDSDHSTPHTPQNGIPRHNSPPAFSSMVPESPVHTGLPNKSQNQYPFLHQPQVTSPMHSALKSSPGIPPQSNMYGNIQSIGGMPYPPGIPIMAPYFGRMQHEPLYSPHQGVNAQFRPLIGPNSVQIPMNMHQIPQGRGFPIQHGPPGFTQGIQNTHGGIARGFSTQKDHPGSQPHSRQQSGNHDPLGPTAHPIARPAPIGRPASVVNGQHHRDMKNDIDDFSNHLGSSALLDDSDEPLNTGTTARRSSAALSQNFVPPFGMGQSTFSSPITSCGSWGGTPNLFGQSSLPDPGLVGVWPSSSFMVGTHNTRPAQSRPVGVRLMICRACKNLEGVTPDGFNSISVIKEQVEQMNPPGEQPVSEKEILDICETEGNAINGGGSFDIREEGNGFCSIRYENETPPHRPLGAPGEIGSPILGNGGVPRIPTTLPQNWY